MTTSAPPSGWRRSLGGAPAPFTVTVAAALSAVPPIVIKVRVRRIVEMALRTVGFAALPEIAAPTILSVRHRLDMRGVHAATITAEVIRLEAKRNRANQYLIGKPMTMHKATTAILAAARTISRIPLFGSAGHPLPASVIQDTNLRPEAWRQASVAKGGGTGKLELHRKVTPFGVTQPEVIGLAAASIIPAGEVA